MTFKIDLLNCSLDATARCKHDRDLVRKILQLKNYITYYLHSLTYQKDFKEIKRQLQNYDPDQRQEKYQKDHKKKQKSSTEEQRLHDFRKEC